MKYLRMLGLAAVAAMTLMAFLGAGSASAATACTTNTSPCTAPITTLGASLEAGSSTVLTSTSSETLNICTSSAVHGNVTNAKKGSSATGPITTLSFTNCTKTTHVLKSGELSFNDSGVLVSKGWEFTITLFGVSCSFGSGMGITIGTVTGGTPGKWSIRAIFRKTFGGFLCPEEAQLTANYVVTNHTSAYVVAE
jgi:hypothetical protein